MLQILMLFFLVKLAFKGKFANSQKKCNIFNCGSKVTFCISVKKFQRMRCPRRLTLRYFFSKGVNILPPPLEYLSINLFFKFGPKNKTQSLKSEDNYVKIIFRLVTLYILVGKSYKRELRHPLGISS